MQKLLAAGLATMLIASTGCMSLRYKKSEDLWAESDQKFKANQYSDAMPYYDELLRRDEADTRARRLRGICRDRSGSSSDALDDFARATDQGDAQALLHRLNTDIKGGFYEAAEKDLGSLRGMTLDTTQEVDKLTMEGTLRLKKGNTRAGVQSLEHACELARGQSDSITLTHARDAHYNAAAAYYQLGEFPSGTEHMEAYRQLSDTLGQGCDGRDFYMLCVLHYLSGDVEGARAYLGRSDPELRRRAGQTFDDQAFFGS